MGTACWGTNKDFDCAWILFGWGSRWDMISETYHRGFWLSLEALKVFLIYDLPNRQHFPYDVVDSIGIPAPANEGFWFTEEEWAKLEPQHQMQYAGFHIDHPEGHAKNVEWYIQAREVCGQFKLNNPTKRFPLPSTAVIIGGDGAPLTETDYPYRDHIFDLNPTHGQIIKNTYERNAIAFENSPRARGFLGDFSKEDYASMYAKEDEGPLLEQLDFGNG